MLRNYGFMDKKWWDIFCTTSSCHSLCICLCSYLSVLPGLIQTYLGLLHLFTLILINFFNFCLSICLWKMYFLSKVKSPNIWGTILKILWKSIYKVNPEQGNLFTDGNGKLYKCMLDCSNPSRLSQSDSSLILFNKRKP